MEPYVRRLVAEHLGVGAEELVSHVSLRDDLAADSLDLVELAVALEREFAIVVPARVVADMHSYSDLVRATAVLIRARCAGTGAAQPPARVVAGMADRAEDEVSDVTGSARPAREDRHDEHASPEDDQRVERSERDGAR